MRDIVIVRGAPGSGKSLFLREAGLDGHTLSMDKIREVVCGDWPRPDGRVGLPQQHNVLVKQIAIESLRRRMENGETVAFEATLPTSADITEITDLAAGFGYSVFLVDMYGMPVDAVKAMNAARPERLRVTDWTVDRFYSEATGSQAPEGTLVATVADGPSRARALAMLRGFLTAGRTRIDLSAYEKVVHVGDLQSTYGPLADWRSPFSGGLRTDWAYLFCGDLFDRGAESAEVARFWMECCQDQPNVWLVGGNHEDWLEAQARGMPVESKEWSERTWPALEAAGYTAADMARIASRVVPYVRYGWRGTEVMVSHGGFPCMPTRPYLLPEHVLRHGVGEYNRHVDARWDEAQVALPEGERVFQVHGHRNPAILPVIASENGWSMNLEGQVEFGGHMRFVVLDEGGWTPVEIRARRYRTMVEADAIDRAAGRKSYGNPPPMTPWALRGDTGLRPISAETLAKFGDHDMINETVSETMPTISAWSFTKAAFHTATWDQWTTVARGLFLDNLDRTVVSRGMPKFHNVGERPETELDAILAGGHGPAAAYVKENGFFATVGYSERLDRLVVTSKSRVEGLFPDLANAMVDRMLGASGRERMLRYCRDQKACLMFEVVDMANDPHVIEEPEDKLVLLACIRRDETFEQVPYATLVRLAKWVGCAAKEKVYANLADPVALGGIIRRVGRDASWRSYKPVEGLVFEFEDGFMAKQKGAYYGAWKRARSAVARIALCRRKGIAFDAGRYAGIPVIGGFVEWAETLPDEALSSGIIALRKEWDALQGNFVPSAAPGAPAVPLAPVPKPRDLSGFTKALGDMVANVQAGRVRLESAARMLASAMADEEKRAILEVHPAGIALQGLVAAAAEAREPEPMAMGR